MGQVTPLIGREYPETQLSEIYNAPNAEAMIKDLAVIGPSFPFPASSL